MKNTIIVFEKNNNRFRMHFFKNVIQYIFILL